MHISRTAFLLVALIIGISFVKSAPHVNSVEDEAVPVELVTRQSAVGGTDTTSKYKQVWRMSPSTQGDHMQQRPTGGPLSKAYIKMSKTQKSMHSLKHRVAANPKKNLAVIADSNKGIETAAHVNNVAQKVQLIGSEPLAAEIRSVRRQLRQARASLDAKMRFTPDQQKQRLQRFRAQLHMQKQQLASRKRQAKRYERKIKAIKSSLKAKTIKGKPVKGRKQL